MRNGPVSDKVAYVSVVNVWKKGSEAGPPMAVLTYFVCFCTGIYRNFLHSLAQYVSAYVWKEL